MTRDEILNMQAGRELDTLIAEKVLGLKSEIEECPYCYSAMWVGAERSWCGQCHEWRYSSYKNYSDDIAAAWEVFEFLTKHSVETVVRPAESYIGHDDGGWSCSIWWFKDIQSSHAVEGIYADTPMLAICRAALLAVMENES